MKRKRKPVLALAEAALKRHFGKTRLHDLVTSSRTFPIAARVDTHAKLLGASAVSRETIP